MFPVSSRKFIDNQERMYYCFLYWWCTAILYFQREKGGLGEGWGINGTGLVKIVQWWCR